MALEAQNNPFTSVLMVGAADPEALPDADPDAGSYRFVIDDTGAGWIVDSTGTAVPVAGTGLTDPMTTRGDVIIRNASNVTDRLGKGTASQVLTSDGTDIAWATPSAGFADPMTTRGDIIRRNASNATDRLGRGTAGQVLTSDGTDVAYATPSNLIEEIVLSGNQATITFDLIPATYKDLRLIGRCRTDRASVARTQMAMRCGATTADSGSNYQQYSENHRADATAARTGDTTGQAQWFPLRQLFPAATATAGRFGNFDITFFSYAKTGFQRQYHALGGSMATNTTVDMGVGQSTGFWTNTTDAIDIITLTEESGGNFVAGSEFRLYGLR